MAEALAHAAEALEASTRGRRGRAGYSSAPEALRQEVKVIEIDYPGCAVVTNREAAARAAGGWAVRKYGGADRTAAVVNPATGG